MFFGSYRWISVCTTPAHSRPDVPQPGFSRCSCAICALYSALTNIGDTPDIEIIQAWLRLDHHRPHRRAGPFCQFSRTRQDRWRPVALVLRLLLEKSRLLRIPDAGIAVEAEGPRRLVRHQYPAFLAERRPLMHGRLRHADNQVQLVNQRG